MTEPQAHDGGSGATAIPAERPDGRRDPAPHDTAPLDLRADLGARRADPDRAPRSRGARRFEITWLAASFVLLSALAFLFPPNGDDWAWGSQIGIQRLDTFFAGYNGRYAANLIVLALTRLPILAPLVIGATVTAILFLVLDIARNRTPWGYAITSGLILAMPVVLWNQTVSWISGFTNYALSTLLVLIFIKAVQMDWRGRLLPNRAAIRVSATVVLAFVSSLFMENVTIFFVVASIVLAVARRRARGRVSADAWAWLAGSVLGAVAMFSNGAYRQLFARGSYQKVTGLDGVITKLLDRVSGYAIIENVALNVTLATVVVLLGVLVARRTGWSRAIAPVVLAVAFIAIAAPLQAAEADGTVALLWRKMGGLAALLLLAALCALAPSVSTARRPLLFGCIGTVVLLNGPLGVVSPLGPRLFLVTYVVLLVIVNVLLQEVADRVGHTAVSGLGVLGTIVAAAMLCSYFVVYFTISTASWNRIDHVRQQVAAGATTVTVAPLPFDDYVHEPDPTPGVWARRYKLYYGLPSDLTITLSSHP